MANIKLEHKPDLNLEEIMKICQKHLEYELELKNDFLKIKKNNNAFAVVKIVQKSDKTILRVYGSTARWIAILLLLCTPVFVVMTFMSSGFAGNIAKEMKTWDEFKKI
jgi:hypothetical protein